MTANVSQAMAQYSNRVHPIFRIIDPVIANYEILRHIWFDGAPIKNVCQRHDLSRSQYYEEKDRFVKHGVLGLFPKHKTLHHSPMLERLIVNTNPQKCPKMKGGIV